MTMASPRWTVEIDFDEDDTHTHAIARAKVRGDNALTASGDAYRNPHDQSRPVIGEEIAAARALIALSTELLQAAASQIEQEVHHPVHLVR
jgi:hypothetical protein